jgi:hypothetical protein
LSGSAGSVYIDAQFPYAIYGPKTGSGWGDPIPFNEIGSPLDLAGGVALGLNRYYYDVFMADRTFGAFGAPGLYSKIVLAVEATTLVNLDFHTNNVFYQSGVSSLAAVAAPVALAAGFWTLTFTRVSGRWILTVS